MTLNILNRNKQVVGLDIGSSTIKTVELRPVRRRWLRAREPGIEELSPDCIVDGVIISKLPVSDAISRIFTQQNIKNRRVATSISGHSVIVKKIALPVQSDEDLAESIRWEAEQYIPVRHRRREPGLPGPGRKRGDGQPRRPPGGRQEGEDHRPHQRDLDGGEEPGGRRRRCICAPERLRAQLRAPSAATVALLDIGASIMTINIVSGSDFLFTRDVGVGGHQYTDFIQKEFNLELRPGSDAEAWRSCRRDRTRRSAARHRLGHRDHLPRDPEDLRFLQVHHHRRPHRPHARQRRRGSHARA